MKKVCAKVLVCLTAVLLLTGQGLAKEPPQSMTVQLNWVPNAQFAGILLAKERGWYREAGIDLTINGWKVGVSSTDEVVAGRAQIGVAEGDALIKARAKGSPVKAIAA